MGTVSYNGMRQNDAFLPFTITGIPVASRRAAGGFAVDHSGLIRPVGRVTSLNGSINTLLGNNVLTTQITPELKSKLTYRYYDYDKPAHQCFLPIACSTDAVSAPATTGHPTYAPVKSRASATPSRMRARRRPGGRSIQWNIGAAYGFERYDWTRADVTSTNENSGKILRRLETHLMDHARVSALVFQNGGRKL